MSAIKSGMYSSENVDMIIFYLKTNTEALRDWEAGAMINRALRFFRFINIKWVQAFSIF